MPKLDAANRLANDLSTVVLDPRWPLNCRRAVATAIASGRLTAKQARDAAGFVFPVLNQLWEDFENVSPDDLCDKLIDVTPGLHRLKVRMGMRVIDGGAASSES